MAKIADTGINPGPEDVWGDGMQTWEVTLDDGQPCKVFRKATSPPLVVGQEIELTGTTKQGDRKGKVASQGGGYGNKPAASYGSPPRGEHRTPEQIIRSTAIGVAVSFHQGEPASTGDAISTASAFESYIANGAHHPAQAATPPAATPPATTDNIPF